MIWWKWVCKQRLQCALYRVDRWTTGIIVPQILYSVRKSERFITWKIFSQQPLLRRYMQLLKAQGNLWFKIEDTLILYLHNKNTIDSEKHQPSAKGTVHVHGGEWWPALVIQGCTCTPRWAIAGGVELSAPGPAEAGILPWSSAAVGKRLQEKKFLMDFVNYNKNI